jgi:FAD dependent oxidoreductase/Pyridine nucleotide-disulphide oxidoreductase
MRQLACFGFVWCCLVSIAVVSAEDVLVEAESFSQPGGWSLDTQFIREMGSPYLLAHGMGKPVADAETTVKFPKTGKYQVFVRTKDWVARWNAPGQPGKFQLLIEGQALPTTFGTEGAKWDWQAGGSVEIKTENTKLALHDLTGFDGRCDAILFTTSEQPPSNDNAILPAWRQKLLGLKAEPTEKAGYDLVVVGGGYAGTAAAISAARSGCKVALIQDRPVLGGNGSSEIRVWAQGKIRRGKYPRLGEIVEEFSDHAKASPAPAEQFVDDLKEKLVLSEKNIELYLNHHAYQVDKAENRITAVYAFDTRTSEQKRFSGRLFVDCTGHATIGALADAEWKMIPEGRMGMSNMWTWRNNEQATPYPETPWALDLAMKDFPYPQSFHGQWFWESGFNKDALHDAEGIRDWNLRAVYGAFNAMKNRDGAEKHTHAELTWVAFVGGPRESRLLQGDVVLTHEDIITKREFPDGCVPSTWSIDLHVPKEQFAAKFPDNPFISKAIFDDRIDRNTGYPVPYRCFYSKNIENLFMAGRNISVTHEALGTVRVMKTCGMMGEVVGKAASICVLHECQPRQVYERYWSELDELMKLPGKAHRDSVKADFVIPKDAAPLADANGPPTGLDPARLEGIVIDDEKAKTTGYWAKGAGLPGYIGYGYQYAGANAKASIRFEVKVPTAGKYDIRIAYQPHENRGTKVPVVAEAASGKLTAEVNMKEKAPLPQGFYSLGQLTIQADETVAITISTENAGGNVHADAVQLVPVK